MLLVVSLDSENDSWLRAHMASGDLPNLAALAGSEVTLPLEAAPLAGTAYASLYSGIRAADHGLHFPVQWDACRQRVVVGATLPYPETVFSRLDRAGKRVVVLDPPELEPLALQHGYAISGLQFRARILLHSWSSHPERTRRLLGSAGESPRADEIFGPIAHSDLRFLRSALLRAPARLEAAALTTLRDDEPDCLWLTCCGLHVAGHQFYDLPGIADQALRREFEGTRLEIARRYDRMLGSLLAALPPRSGVIVTYAKGMGGVTSRIDLLPQMLRRVLGEREVLQPVSSLREALPRSVRRWMAGLLSDARVVRMMAELSTPRADWSRTRAFCVPSDYPGFIRFNRKGREREGIVPDSERRELQQQLIAGLQSFTDPDGYPCIDRIDTPEELFGSGRRLGDLPDLIVTWTRRPAPSADAIHSPRFGEIRRRTELVGRSGNHIPGAFAILSGGEPGTPPGPVLQIEDIAVTILDALGVSADELPGRSFWSTCQAS